MEYNFLALIDKWLRIGYVAGQLGTELEPSVMFGSGLVISYSSKTLCRTKVFGIGCGGSK